MSAALPAPDLYDRQNDLDRLNDNPDLWGKFKRSCEEGLAFAEEGHTYRRGDERLPSVTEIVSAVLPDHGGVRLRWTERHRRMGIVTHACTALDDLGTLDESTVVPAVRGRLEAWRKFRRTVGDRFKPLLVEQRMWSVMGIAGTADRIGLWDGRPCVLDIKSFVDEPYTRLQTSGYASLFHERTDVPVMTRIAVGLRDDETWDFWLWSAKDWLEDRNAFSAAVRLYAFLARHRLLKGG